MNDDLAVKREEGFIRCSRIKLDNGEYRKKIKQVDYDKCTEELGDSSPVRKRLQLRVAFQQTTLICDTLLMTWYTKPLLVRTVHDHDSNDKFRVPRDCLYEVSELVRLAGLARFTS